jgi:hypothetical protein
MAEHESALIEAMRLNTELARSLIEWVPRMMETAAALMRAAAARSRAGDDAVGTGAAAAEPAITSSDEAAAGVEPMVPPLDRGAMAHFLLVQAMLTAEESAVARAAAKELSPAELRSWFEALSKLSVADAAARVRKLIGARGGAA